MLIYPKQPKKMEALSTIFRGRPTIASPIYTYFYVDWNDPKSDYIEGNSEIPSWKTLTAFLTHSYKSLESLGNLIDPTKITQSDTGAHTNVKDGKFNTFQASLPKSKPKFFKRKLRGSSISRKIQAIESCKLCTLEHNIQFANIQNVYKWMLKPE